MGGITDMGDSGAGERAAQQAEERARKAEAEAAEAERIRSEQLNEERAKMFDERRARAGGMRGTRALLGAYSPWSGFDATVG